MTAARAAYVSMSLILGSGVVSAAADCRCRSDGQYFGHGQVICMLGKLARCEKSLNNASWTIIADACPEVQLKPPLAMLAEMLHPPTSK